MVDRGRHRAGPRMDMRGHGRSHNQISQRTQVPAGRESGRVRGGIRSGEASLRQASRRHGCGGWCGNNDAHRLHRGYKGQEREAHRSEGKEHGRAHRDLRQMRGRRRRFREPGGEMGRHGYSSEVIRHSNLPAIQDDQHRYRCGVLRVRNRVPRTGRLCMDIPQGEEHSQCRSRRTGHQVQARCRCEILS